MTYTKVQLKFLMQWTWFDTAKVHEFIRKGEAIGAGEWARSAARDVLHSENLKGLLDC